MMNLPIIHYEFNDSNNLGADSSGNGFHSTNIDVDLVIDTERGNVASFNGSTSKLQSVLNSPSSILGSSSRTFMLWAKKTGGNNDEYFHAQGDLSTGEWSSYANYPNSTYQIRTLTPRVRGTYTAGWNHFANTYDGSIVRGYVNGVEIGNVAAAINTADSKMTFGFGNLEAGLPYTLEGFMSDFRVYDVALSASEIFAHFAGPYFGLTPWSTLVEASWSSIGNAMSYRLTIDSGSGESLAIDNTTSLENVCFNLDPDTTYTFRLYYSTDGITYTLDKQESTATLSDTSANANIEVFEVNGGGAYDLSPLNEATRSRLDVHINNVLTSGDQVILSDDRVKGKKLTLVARGATSPIPEGNAIIFPFNPSIGSSQSATLQLSDSSTVLVSYDESENTISVRGTVFSAGDTFVLDDKKVVVYDA